MNLVSVIPARKGSKSIPLKNIQLLNKRPLISYSILYSKNCPLVAHTVVSTDSHQIAEIAKEFGAEVPFIRPDEIAQDLTQDFPVIQHALEQLERIYRTEIDAIAWLRPTSPLRPEGLIERALDILKSNPDCTSVRSVVKSAEHPYRQWFSDGELIKSVVNEQHVHEPYNIPRQQLPNVYFQSGDLELVRRETIVNGSISGDKVMPLVIKQDEMLDIDHYSDLVGAETKISDG